jgi:hypothetical protein
MTWTLSSLLTYAYRGTFHAYLRYRDVPAGVAGYPFTARLSVGQSVGYYDWSSQTVPLYKKVAAAAAGDYVADLGLVRLPLTTPLKVPHWPSNSVRITVTITETAGVGGSVDLLDLVLIPADEWIGDVSANLSNYNEGLSVFDYIDIDSATMPYYPIWVQKRDTGRTSGGSITGFDKATWTAHASEPAFFQVESSQRLWFLALGRYDPPNPLEFFSGPHMLQSVYLAAVRRYLLTRGDQ